VLVLTAQQPLTTNDPDAAAYFAASMALVRLTGCGGGGGIDCTSCSATCSCCWALQEATGAEQGVAFTAAAAGVAPAVAAESQLLAGSATRLHALPLQCCCVGADAATNVTCRMRLVPTPGVLTLLLGCCCCCLGWGSGKPRKSATCRCVRKVLPQGL
jgi:hypothetical protein